MKRFIFIILLCLWVDSSEGALTQFRVYSGPIGYSSDGFGSTSTSGTISASVPAGATVEAAYLYTGFFCFTGCPFSPSSTLAGTAVTFGPNSLNLPDACCGIGSARADVTSIIKPLIDGGIGGTYNFTVTEGDARQDGEALVVVYSLSTLPTRSVGIFDGFASVLGDTTTINFTEALHPANPGFSAEMILGINFSCCGQRSNITVNGTLITQNAGNNDDGAILSNGSLITVGGFDDPFSTLLPNYADDHERYNLIPRITDGNTSMTINTVNGSQDDNVFLLVYQITGEVVGSTPITPTPTPTPTPISQLGTCSETPSGLSSCSEVAGILTTCSQTIQ